MRNDSAFTGSSLAGTSAERRAPEWRLRHGALSLDRPRVMGIINLTADSFWPESRVPDVQAAVDRAGAAIEAGADLLDLGAESTRPGARPVPAAAEAERVVPVIRALSQAWPHVPLSVDTVKADVAAAAVEAGAAIINDVSGFRLDAGMARVAAETGAGVVLMHSRGTVEDMASYSTAAYQRDPVATIVAELSDALDLAVGAGVETGRIVLDPGLGFSKRTEHSAAILQELDRVLALGRPVLVGPSRKRFLAELAGGVPVDARLPGTLAACVTALLAGARIFRVHDVAAARQALDVAEALAPRAGGV